MALSCVHVTSMGGGRLCQGRLDTGCPMCHLSLRDQMPPCGCCGQHHKEGPHKSRLARPRPHM
eukprot:358619-Chlamydomonas_euryale.AAC.5